jgi:hypothetical protein
MTPDRWVGAPARDERAEGKDADHAGAEQCRGKAPGERAAQWRDEVARGGVRRLNAFEFGPQASLEVRAESIVTHG